MSEQKIPIPAMLYNAAVGGHVTSSQQIIDEDYNLEQKDINKETLGVPYNASNPNGMGKIVLKKTDNFKTVVEAQTNGNTIFVIKYDFTLTDDVTIPSTCVLQFEGGSISGAHTLTGTYTDIVAGLVKIFGTDITLAGTWNVAEAYPEWFGAKGDGTTDDTQALQKVINYFDTIILRSGSEYRITDTINISAIKAIIGKNRYDTQIKFDIAGNSDIVLFNVTTNRFTLKSFTARATIGSWPLSANRYGIFLKNSIQLQLNMSDVDVRGFNYGLEVKILITSYFNNCAVVGCNYGLIVRKGNDVLTTTRFNNCYISQNLRNITLEKSSLIDISFIGSTLEGSCYYNFLNKGGNPNIIFDNCYTEHNCCGRNYNGGSVEDIENILNADFISEYDGNYEHSNNLTLTNCVLGGKNSGTLHPCVKYDAGNLNMINCRCSRYSAIVELTSNYSLVGSIPKYKINAIVSYLYSSAPSFFVDDTLLRGTDFVNISYLPNVASITYRSPVNLRKNYSINSINSIENGLTFAFTANGATNGLAIKKDGYVVQGILGGMTMFGKQTENGFHNYLNSSGIGIFNNDQGNITSAIRDAGYSTENTNKYFVSFNNYMYLIYSDGTSYKAKLLCAGSFDSDGRPVLSNNDYCKGYCHFDATLGHPIWWNGTAWVDATGTTV